MSHEISTEPTTMLPGHPDRMRSAWPGRLIPATLVIGLTALMFAPLVREAIGGIAVALMLVLIFLRVQVGIALTVPGLLGLYVLSGLPPLETILSTLPYHEIGRWQLSVLPMFVLMGLLLWKSGMTERIYVVAREWLGWLPGGLAIGTNTAGAGLAAISGSTVGTTYALARIGVPEMLKAGYDRRLAVGAVIVAGLPGQLIPPSIFLVVYAGIAQVPVGPQLIAGIGPGLLVATCFGAMILLIAVARPQLAGGNQDTPDAPPMTERVRNLVSIWPLPALIAVVLGGMFTGVVTATEAGAAGALGACLIALWYQRRAKPWNAIASAANGTVATCGAIFLLLVGAFTLSRLLAVSGIGTGFADWVAGLGLARVQFLLLLVVAYLILGMFMDPLSIMLLTVPLLIPTLNSMDISLLWFGVFVVFMAELGILTPPVGLLSFIIHKITQEPEVNHGQEISLGDVFVAVAWFMPVTLVVCLLLIFFPEVATFLPDRM
jgi:tripartite ATP-independent transporter DctM subunit